MTVYNLLSAHSSASPDADFTITVEPLEPLVAIRYGVIWSTAEVRAEP